MEHREKEELLDWLERGRRTFLQAVEGIAEDAAARVPAPGRWSVLECTEHVAVVEAYLYDRLLEGRPAGGEPVPPRGREALIRERAPNPTRPVAAPDVALPAGRYPTLAAALADFVARRDRTIAWLRACDEDLRARLTMHPILGAATCYELVMMMAAHPERHARQIAGIRAASAGAGAQ